MTLFYIDKQRKVKKFESSRHLDMDICSQLHPATDTDSYGSMTIELSFAFDTLSSFSFLFQVKIFLNIIYFTTFWLLKSHSQWFMSHKLWRLKF